MVKYSMRSLCMCDDHILYEVFLPFFVLKQQLSPLRPNQEHSRHTPDSVSAGINQVYPSGENL